MKALSCEEANLVIEAAAMGDPVPEALDTHIAGCRACASRLTLARRIDRALQERTVPLPSPGFTAGVMARLRREQWRAEQVVDFGFNLALAAGILFIVAGLAGLAWQFGALQIGDDLVTMVAAGVGVVARRAATDTRFVMFGMLLVTTAAGLWWWAEEDLML